MLLPNVNYAQFKVSSQGSPLDLIRRTESEEEFLVLERYYDLEERFNTSITKSLIQSEDKSCCLPHMKRSDSFEEFLHMDRVFGADLKRLFSNPKKKERSSKSAKSVQSEGKLPAIVETSSEIKISNSAPRSTSDILNGKIRYVKKQTSTPILRQKDKEDFQPKFNNFQGVKNNATFLRQMAAAAKQIAFSIHR